MAEYQVTTNLDVVNGGDGVLSLREAIIAANADPGSTITFAASLANQTITLTLGALPAITTDTSIDGAALDVDGNPVSQNITISGAGAARVFFVIAGDVSFRFLTLANGKATGGDGGTAGGGGGMGAGAAIFVNAGNTTITDITFTNNVALGGAGGPGATGSAGGGGGGLGGAGANAVGSNGGAGGGALAVGGTGGTAGGDGGPGPDFAGGGGGAINGGKGGVGGFGGGGGGGAHSATGNGGNGGAGGFGGGGGGGGDTAFAVGIGGIGGIGGGIAANGTSTVSGGGGGGAALGGAIFVRDGASLTLGSGAFNTSVATAGGGSGAGGGGGSAGSDLFLMSSLTSNYTFAPAIGQTLTFNGTIADDSAAALPGGAYTAGTGAGAQVSITGEGTVVYTAGHVYSYAGATIVSNGLLRVNGTLSNSALTISGIGTVDGTGTIGQVTVLEGGKLAPGAGGAGTLHSGNLRFFDPADIDHLLAPGILAIQLGGTSAGQFDVLDVVGTVNLTGANFSGELINGYSPATGNTFIVIQNDGGDAVVGTFAGVSEGGFVTVGGRAFQVSYIAGTGNDVSLTAIANAAPTLTGLGPTVAFTRSTVSTPQIFDPSVVFNDLEGNFNGGTLTITGVLAQDTFSINQTGFDPGEFFINGNQVLYGGTSIGIISGGNGSNLTIAFNGNATTNAIDAMIENFTYANSASNPTISHVVTVTVTDSAAASTGGQQVTIKIPAPPSSDFNGDSKGDILWQNDNGTPAIWTMDGLNFTGAAQLTNPGPSWHAKDHADFNGDGKADILWQNDNGTPAIWLMDGFNLTGAALLPNPAAELARQGGGRFQRRRQGRHPVAERQRHAGDLDHGRSHLHRRRAADQSQSELARHRRRRFQRRRQGRHPVAERRRHAGRLADGRLQPDQRRAADQSQSELARQECRRLQRRRQGRHSLAERQRSARDLADGWPHLDERGGSHQSRCRPGTPWKAWTSTATARPTFFGKTTMARPRSGPWTV